MSAGSHGGTPLAALLAARDRGQVRWVGLMSGTSGDGIDAARVVVRETEDGPRVEEVEGGTIPFDSEFRTELRDAVGGTGSFAEAARLDRALGERFAEAARVAIESHGPVDAIALSGHTVSHLPAANPAATLQVGAPSIVAERVGLPVVAGFRTADLARGGEGAPLVPAGDRVLYGHLGDPLAVVNVGGISNVTWLVRGADPTAADAGPGNLILDAAYRDGATDGAEFDRDGRVAQEGRVVSSLLDRWTGWNERRGTRRSTGREEFGEAWWAAERARLAEHPSADRLATLCAWIAEEIARTIAGLAGGRAPERTLVGGGGAHHGRLRADLVDRLVGGPVEMLRAEEHGVGADLREAAAFAILGHEWLYRRPGSFPGTTGAAAAGPLGALALPGGDAPVLAGGPGGP